MKFSRLQKSILKTAAAWFELGVEEHISGNKVAAKKSMAQYHRLTTQVFNETRCELWEMIQWMGDETSEMPVFKGTRNAVNNLSVVH